MKLSWRWLGRHVDLTGLTPQQVVEDLTLSVCEVEGLEPFAPALADVTVGHVVQREQHPDADKLSLCRVDVGAGEPLQIVCGAPNVRAGLKVAVAQVGTTLPGDLKIKKSKIRGVESHGMICSERELGLGDEHDGIWELPDDARVGAKVAEAVDVGDWVIEIDNKSLTHRPDLWGHRGMAAEVAALYGRSLKPLDTSLPASGDAQPWPVRIDSPAASRYVALPIDGARATKSPEWLRHLLLAVGQRPLDVLVDLSNFVMLDLGQPNHLFDRRRLSPEGIVVRAARAGETLTTLDGVERKLVESDLLICSGPEPVALAGVMGGAGSKVEGSTDALLFEAAAFAAAGVRRTSARLGLRSDASARFEKSLDPHLPLAAAGHFARLLRGLQPAVTLPAPATDVGDWSDPSLTLALSGARTRALLGVDLSDERIADILTRLGFRVTPAVGGFAVRVPAARATKDVTVEQDLIEEVGRHFRYGNVPERALVAELAPQPRDAGWRRRMLARAVEDRLAGAARFHQVLSYSFVPDALLAALGLDGLPHVEVLNPAAEGLARMRRSVLPSLLARLATNRRLREDVRLFEVGKGYLPEHANERGEPREVHELGLVWCGTPREPARFDDTRVARLQGVLEDLLHSLQLPAPTWRAASAEERPAWAHPGRCALAQLAPDAPSAVLLAPLDPALARALELEGELASEVACAVVSLDVLLDAPRAPATYRPAPVFPGAKVDVALALPAEVRAATAREAILRAGKGQAEGLELFDVYQGERLGNDRRSLAWHVTLQAPDRSPTDKDVAKFLDRLAREAEALGGELRRE
ncbi:MAG TPA: phenylalanine--tRNA ligase subunit beta [Planctomycetota bacterium]|nr:phenylalanine--tRNA ligase subunit beta [Planctomycetota bacterium]